MCGIVGYIGDRTAVPILVEGLRRLEYRGYDSAGLAVLVDGRVETRKAAGKIVELERILRDGGAPVGTIGIAHTRWATHGAPTTNNAHPHVDCAGRFAVVHNGIIENAGTLRQKLEALGHTFRTETDTEVVAHMIEEAYAGSLEEAVRAALRQIEGTYGLAILSSHEPDRIVVARRGSPLLLGIGERGEYYVASDVAAILAHTRRVIYLDDGEMAVLTKDGYETLSLKGGVVSKEIDHVSWDLEAIEKGGHEHFMLKEIFEQPETLRNAMRGRLLEEDGNVRLGGVTLSRDELLGIDNIVITACGTSWHSALIGEYMLEELARIPVEVEYASEFRYRNPIVDERTLVIVISQSGETADTLAALRRLPEQVEQVLELNDAIRELARTYKDAPNFLYLGRGYNFPTALEGALKLKEISYIHAEGYPAAEMKHGPIALIDENMPVVVIAPNDAVYNKIVSNIEEVRARGGRVIAVVTDGNDELAGMVDHLITIPQTIDILTPILATIPLQLLAYHIAVMRGCNVDMPRNLAKSVTVE